MDETLTPTLSQASIILDDYTTSDSNDSNTSDLNDSTTSSYSDPIETVYHGHLFISAISFEYLFYYQYLFYYSLFFNFVKPIL